MASDKKPAPQNAPKRGGKKNHASLRAIYPVIGILLIPAAIAFTRSWWLLLTAWWQAAPSGRTDLLVLAAGFLVWLVLSAFMPAPLRLYIFAHEISHAFWGALLGARLGRMRISRQGGAVELSETNPLSVLAPYFFPFYAVLALLAGWVASWFIDAAWLHYTAIFTTGLALGFHATFTIQALSTHQPDLSRYGIVFSLALIYCANLIALIIITAALGKIPLAILCRRLAADCQNIYNAAMYLVNFAADYIQRAIKHGLDR